MKSQLMLKSENVPKTCTNYFIFNFVQESACINASAFTLDQF